MNKLTNKLLFILIFFLAIFLRFSQLSNFPPSLYWEEVALGYDAFSLLETGEDHHGNAWPIVAFESFGDWKPSGYFYMLIPFIKVLGLNAVSVRLPSALSGLILVILIAKIAQWLYRMNPQKMLSERSVFFITLAVGAISPWAIQFSRAAWEVNVATGFLTFGCYLGIRGIFKREGRGAHSTTVFSSVVFHLFFASLFLALSAYTYHATRIIAPLLGAGLLLLWYQSSVSSLPHSSLASNILLFLKKRWQALLILGLSSLLFLLPLLLSFSDQKVTQRFAETSIFSNIALIQESNLQIELGGNAFIAKLLHHRFLYFGREIIKNFADHFTIDYLFLSGDSNPRHSIGWTGQLYHIEIIFLVLGIYWLLKQRNKYYWFLFFWLVIAIVPASITHGTPHALRTLPALPVFVIVISFGIQEFILLFSHQLRKLPSQMSIKEPLLRKFLLGMILFAYCLELSNFWRYYSKVSPKLASSEWQYGYSQMIEATAHLQTAHKTLPVYISRKLGRPAMYYWFYTNTDPKLVQEQNSKVTQDQGEYLEFLQLKFIDQVDEIEYFPAIAALTEEEARVLSENDVTFENESRSTIVNLNGETVWIIGVLKK